MMNIAKIAIFLALGSMGAQALADQSHSTVAASKTPIESYTVVDLLFG